MKLLPHRKIRCAQCNKVVGPDAIGVNDAVKQKEYVCCDDCCDDVLADFAQRMMDNAPKRRDHRGNIL